MRQFHTVSSTVNHVSITFLGTDDTVGDRSDYQMALKRAWWGVRCLWDSKFRHGQAKPAFFGLDMSLFSKKKIKDKLFTTCPFLST
jgi:hypothetical protein